MPVAAYNDTSAIQCVTAISFPVTDEEEFLIRRAAESRGWTVADYVRCSVLDQAERDLYLREALDEAEDLPAVSVEPIADLMGVLGER